MKNLWRFDTTHMVMITIAVAVLMIPPDVQSAKIVAYPLDAYSHTYNFIRVGEELIDRGHTFTLLLSTWIENKLKDKIHLPSLTYYSYLNDDITNFCIVSAIRDSYPPSNCSTLYGYQCANTSNDQDIIQAIAQADILLCDVCSTCCHVLAKIAKVPIVVDYSSLGFLDPIISSVHRVPNPLAYVPQMGTDFSSQMTFSQRLLNALGYAVVILFKDYVMVPPFNQILHQQGIHNQDVYIDTSPAHILLIASDFAVEFPRPITPSVKMIGPVTTQPAKPLSQELEDFINSNSNGFIFVSFGTVAVALNAITDIQDMAKGLGQLPYNVIWKYTGSPIKNLPANIKTVTWAPQNDVLGHPKIKAFISHCGMNSVLEAAYHGVPVVAVPLMYDQPGNAQKIVITGMAKIINFRQLNAKSIEKIVRNVTDDPKYAHNAVRVSAIMKDRPSGRTSIQEAADWIEYALRFDGGKHLLGQQMNIPFYQRYLLDVIAFIVVVIYLVYSVIRITCGSLYRRCCTKKTKQD